MKAINNLIKFLTPKLNYIWKASDPLRNQTQVLKKQIRAITNETNIIWPTKIEIFSKFEKLPFFLE